MCRHECTKVWPGLATHDVFAERRLRAWRPDIRYTLLPSLTIHSIHTVSLTRALCNLSLSEHCIVAQEMALPNPFTYWRRTENTREYVSIHDMRSQNCILTSPTDAGATASNSQTNTSRPRNANPYSKATTSSANACSIA